MKKLPVSDLLNEIGQRVANALDRTPNDVFVFIEAGDQWCGGAIFEDLENAVIYHDFSDDIDDIVLRLWEAAEPSRKWSIILYDIKNGRFDAEFIYTDDLDHHPFEHDYREEALIERYGDKPVIYPDPEPGLLDLTEDDLKAS